MALPVLKCPFLSQLTVQQVRASAPNILNTGVQSCPIFSQFARKISTTTVQESGQASAATRPYSIDELKAVHQSVNKLKGKTPIFQSKYYIKKPNPYGESKNRIFSTENILIGFVLKLSSRLIAKIFFVHT